MSEKQKEVDKHTALVEYIAAHILLCLAEKMGRESYLGWDNAVVKLKQRMTLQEVRDLCLTHPEEDIEDAEDEIPF